jgi:hypothetical protein
MTTRRRQGRPKVSEAVEEGFIVEEERELLERRQQEEEQAILEQFGILEGVLDHQQLMTLAALDRLEKSLHGPQALLEVAGGFSRPTPPAYITPEFTTIDDPGLKL